MAINIIKAYNLLNPKGKRLQLRLGILNPENRDKFCDDTGYRWSFIGKEIPMPVRSGTWFNGFPADTMLSWLYEHEWYVETEIEMYTGKAKVYELPEAPEEYAPETMANDEAQFNHLIQNLCAEGKRMTAIRLYRFTYEVGSITAMKAVTEICNA